MDDDGKEWEHEERKGLPEYIISNLIWIAFSTLPLFPFIPAHNYAVAVVCSLYGAHLTFSLSAFNLFPWEETFSSKKREREGFK